MRDILISVSDIADIAGVSASAVSNWRKRHDDFPTPHRNSGNSSLFSVREVETWLLENGKITDRIQPEQLLWAIWDSMRAGAEHDDLKQLLLACIVTTTRCPTAIEALEADDFDQFAAAGKACLRPLGLTGPGSIAKAAKLQPDMVLALAHAVHDVTADALDESPLELYWSIAEKLTARDRTGGMFTSRAWLAHLMASLPPQLGESILDLTLGEGGGLLTAATRAQPDTALTGVDVDVEAAIIARAWTIGLGVEAEIWVRNALDLDNLLTPATTVLADPPFGLKGWGTADLYVDERWPLAPVSANNADHAWMQRAWMLTAPGGYAVIHMAPSSTYSTGPAGHVRTAMLERGLVRAVVHLPERTMRLSGTATSLWLVSADASDRAPLVVDARKLGSKTKTGVELSAAEVGTIVNAVHTWIEHGRVDDTVSEWVLPAHDWEDQDGVLSPEPYLPVITRDPKMIEQEIDELGNRLEEHLGPPLPALTPSYNYGSADDLFEWLHDTTQIAARPTKLRSLAKIISNRRVKGIEPDSVDAPVPDGHTRIIVPRRTHGAWFLHPTDLPDEDADELEPLQPGDIMVRMGHGNVELVTVPEHARDWVVFDPNLVIRPKDPSSDMGRWVRFWCLGDAFADQVDRRRRGTTIARASRRALADIEIPLPSGPMLAQAPELHSRVLAAADAYEAATADLRRHAALVAELAASMVR